MKALSTYIKEPILDLLWRVWGYEVLTGRDVILGDREFIFSNLNEIIDFILFETHVEELIHENDVYLSFNLKPQTLLAFGKRLERYTAPNLIIEVREDNVPLKELYELKHLKESLNLALCIDDFGVGNANLERLFLLEPDFVKIDMKVFSKLPYACRKSALKNIVNLIRDTTRSQIIFEKVENPEDIEIAGEIGVNLWQGFLYYRKV